jgi:hypothetical protein
MALGSLHPVDGDPLETRGEKWTLGTIHGGSESLDTLPWSVARAALTGS